MVRTVEQDLRKNKRDIRRIIENKILCDVPGCGELLVYTEVFIQIPNAEIINCKALSMVVMLVLIESTHITNLIIVRIVDIIHTLIQQDLV